MLHVQLKGGTLSLSANAPVDSVEPQLWLAEDATALWGHTLYFVTCHKNVLAGEGIHLSNLGSELPDIAAGTTYELVLKSAPKPKKVPILGGVMQISVVYDGFDPALDDRIRAALQTAGFEWYASGLNYADGERDLAFDVLQRP